MEEKSEVGEGAGMRKLVEGLGLCVLPVIILPLNVVSIVLPFLLDVVRARSGSTLRTSKY